MSARRATMKRALLVVSMLVCALALPAHASRPAVQQVDIDEHLGAALPLDLPFVDQNGRPVRLGDYFHDGKPVVLVLAYFRCPMLCDLVLHGVLHSLTKQHLVLGRDYRALTVSIDPKDTPAAAARKQEGMLQGLDMPEKTAAWPFLTGAQPNIAALAARVGFQYAYDPKTDQYAHPACAFVITPEGRISRYLYGVKFRPLDVRLALDEAAHGKIGGIVDRVLLCCFRYDPATRRYGWYVKGVLRGGATLTLLIVGGALGILWRRERRRRNDA
jgi:protein SCO1/2